jgi:hypothetical protein
MENKDYAGKYKLHSAALTGTKTINIANLIKEFNVRESLNLMFAVYTFHVIDAITLLESINATGSETIKLEICMDDSDNLSEVELVVIGYNGYKRPTNQSQSYTITAITKSAFISAVRRVSRDVSGSALSVLQDLYSEVSQDAPNIKDARDDGNFRGIIPNLTYQETFNYLLTKASSAGGGTFFFFETLWGGPILSSYKTMITEQPVRKYKLTDDANTAGDLQRQTIEKIKSIRSDIGMSTYRGFKGGGITARTHMVDLSTKEYEVEFIDFTNEDLPMLRDQYTVSNNFDLVSLDETEGQCYLFNRNKLAYSESYVNFNDNLQATLPRKKAILENIFSMQHTIEVAGVEDLQCGAIIEINIQQATDPTLVDVHTDELLSGPYLITEISHTFRFDGDYTAELNIKRDSFNSANRGGII